MLRLIGVGDNVVDCNYTTGIMYPGGNSLNFSVYGRQLGHETAYAGVFGHGHPGRHGGPCAGG